MLVTKSAAIAIVETSKAGGRIRISTPGADRDKDRVFPAGCRPDRYKVNPIVQWGHMTYEPWQTVGRTTDLVITADGIDATFELREPATDNDPQHIVTQLWAQRYINAASIGFMPLSASPNDLGGLDFLEWELLEWSLVPLPANADALRLAYEAAPLAAKNYGGWLVKAGRVLSKANEQRLRQAHSSIGEVLSQLADDGEAAVNYGPGSDGNDDPDEDPHKAADLALHLPGITPAPAPASIDLTAIYNALAGLKAAGIKRS